MTKNLPAMPAPITTADANEHSGAELTTADGRSLPLVAATLRGDARGGIARLVLEQTFENRHDDTLHVTYRMPLPADGAVSGYAFQIGDRRIVGSIDKKRAARERFERAIVEGHTAALLEQDRADIFTQKLGNIGPRESIVATITIDQRLTWLPEGEWELRFPTVIGPRYIGADDTAADVAATAIQVELTTTTKKPGVSIELAIHDSLTGRASSPSHSIEAAPTTNLRGPVSHETKVVLKKAAKLDRDIVVRWPVASNQVGVSVHHARTSGDLAYGLVTIVPPQPSSGHAVLPRDLIVLLDTSGSMDGVPLELAKVVVAHVIESLDDGDRLELIEFSNEPNRYTKEPIAATEKAKRAAIAWVRSREANGGTEMRRAVVEAMKSLRPYSQRQVVVVTDGYIGGEDQLVKMLGNNLPESCRLHVLAVGAAVNRSLATSLARVGRGCEVIVGPGEDPERGAKRLVDKTKQPVLTNLTIEGTAVIDHVPANLPDVFAKSPLVAAIALSETGGTVTVRGQLATGPWEQTVRVPALRKHEGDPAIVALYARERVADLDAQWGENHDSEIESVGLAYQIATRMTSWIAVDMSRKVTGPSRHENMPQELPFGTRAESFGLRAQMSTLALGDSFAPMLLETESDADEVAEEAVDRRLSTRAGGYPAGPSGQKSRRKAGVFGSVAKKESEPSAPAEKQLAQENRPVLPSDDQRAAKKPAPMPQSMSYTPAEMGKIADILQAQPAKAATRSKTWLVWLFVLAVLAALLAWWLV